MSVKVVNTSGNGSFVEGSLIDFSYQEDISPIEPTTIDGGTGQISFSVESVNSELSGTKLMINNQMSLVDDANGSVDFQVKSISISDGNVASFTGDTLSSKLNAVKTAKPFPHAGSDYTLKAALDYYCSLVDIVPIYDNDFDLELDAVERNFIGWKANVWEQLKSLCAGVSASDTDNVGIEVYAHNGELHFRKALTTVRDTHEKRMSETLAIDSTESAKSIDVVNYNTFYAENKVIFEEKNYTDTNAGPNAFRASITDNMQVEAGEVLVKRFAMAATLETINQPVCVETITPLPYDGPTGKYVIVGSDNLPIQPAQWVGEGGKIEVSLTDVPNEIEIKITGPKAESLPLVSDPAKNTLAPYKIGVETSDGADYPAFYITGSGVFYNKQTVSILTGASANLTTVDESPTSIDNIFITTPHDASARGVAAAQVACGPNVNFTRTIDGTEPFGTLIGSTEYTESNRFRVKSAAYTDSDISLTYSAYTTFDDFNAKWTGRTIGNFDTTVSSASMLFNEFTIIPLLEEI